MGMVTVGMVTVRCPITGGEIATGIETDPETLAHLPNVDVAVHCPECGEKHFWSRENAYVADETNGGKMRCAACDAGLEKSWSNRTAVSSKRV